MGALSGLSGLTGLSAVAGGAAAPLAAPTNLSAEVGQDSGNRIVTLTYTPSPTATGNDLDLSINGGAFEFWGQLGDNSGTFVFNDDVQPDIVYKFRLKATNGEQTSDPSNVAGAILVTTFDTFAFPVGATNRIAVAIGAGGTADATGNGGGGGALSIKTLTNSELTYNCTIGASLTAMNVDATFYVTAQRGQDADGLVPGDAGSAAAGTGDTKYSGGRGGAADVVSHGGGGGGGAAGTTGNGANGEDGDSGWGGAAGSGGTLSGAGGDGGSMAGNPGSTFGGGGGGPDGVGAGGCIALTWRQAS